ncbi:hypothetical protein [Actinomycetospora straminea]|uniref:Uncharacterized protein n=1 Tax=Actinomycetospora straminea TaxID=663607 RepID=A0ABP9E987_9PSEU|nr:hypothetical protein [Actinomycetospora straminea]MDD7932022.1 hypothetical protein [Actinomycetospora straminea]
MTRGPGPASHEPDGPGPAGPLPLPPPLPADECDTTVLPVVGAAETGRTAPALPEVPAIADIAAPGRPDVSAVVDAVGAPEEPPARRRPRPSRHMRARADEMARLLSRAPGTGHRERRGLSSVPAAAAVLAAVAVGGVGIALGLDAQRTGAQIALPGLPDVPAEPTPVPETDGTTTVPTVDTGVVGALEPDVSVRVVEPSSVAVDARRAPQPVVPPRATTSSARTRPSATTPRSTTPDRPTTSTPTPRSTASATPRADGGEAAAPREDAAVGSRGLDEVDDGSATSSSPLDGGSTTAN